MSFDEITEILKNDKFALDEFGVKTDLDELHKYQDKIDISDDDDDYVEEDEEEDCLDF